ncbi:hypothetical protein JW905_17925 [bacterium]|nr:hypothetical protein [candidate division CSSED10-310 bacterium]
MNGEEGMGRECGLIQFHLDAPERCRIGGFVVSIIARACLNAPDGIAAARCEKYIFIPHRSWIIVNVSGKDVVERWDA